MKLLPIFVLTPRILILPAALVLLATGSPAAENLARMPERHAAFFQNYCLECHNAEKQKGKVRLDDLPFDIADIQTADRWQKILNSLNSGEMPPEDEKQPTAADKTEFLESLSHTMVTARRALSDEGGLIAMRRLNRREYANTLRDLLGVTVDVRGLPSDASSSGFDTAGKSLFFSSDQFEQYLALARTALDEVLAQGGPRPQTRREVLECEDEARAVLRKGLKNWGDELENANKAIASGNAKKFGYPDVDRAKFMKGNADLRLPILQHLEKHPLSATGALLTYFAGHTRQTVAIPAEAAPGAYRLRVKAAALQQGVQPGRHFLELAQRTGAAKGENAFSTLGGFRITGTPEQPQQVEIPVTVTKSGPREFVLMERGAGDKARKGVVAFRQEMAENEIGPPPSLWLDSVEWEGPLVSEWPSAAWRQIFFKGSATPQDAGYAREIIVRFAERAFRGKPVEPEFVEKLAAIFDSKRRAGLTFEQALREPLAIVLAAPSFLYLVEPVEAAEAAVKKRQPVPLSGIEVANRLSYFLWSAPPDEALLAAARNGELLKPAVLARETDRLLDDPKALDFISGFVSQWLHMERLDFFQFNPALYPDFDASAKLAARDEVFHTFHQVLREKLPLKTLLKADFVVVNDLMAAYYGLPGVSGPSFRKVALPADSPRGGMLGMAAILAMGSDGERSSPVERGAFVLRKLLNNPPPPAPANVPQLSRLAGQALPARKLLAAHMEEAQCAQCHRRIDPIGFGLENFNAAGLWRTEELLEAATNPKKGKKAKPAKKKNAKKAEPATAPIDPSGQLPDGTAFRDYFQLREVVANRHETFARGMTEALIEFALGRPFGFADEALAEDLLKAAEASGHTPAALIHALVQSKAFQTK